MSAPQDVRIFAVQDRRARATTRPWVVRWSIDGREHSKSFELKDGAEDWRRGLRQARVNGERFDVATGQPKSWVVKQLTAAQHAHEWLRREWPTWSSYSRRDAVMMMKFLLPLLVSSEAPALTPAQAATLRGEIDAWARPGAKIRDGKGKATGARRKDAPMPDHLHKYSLALRDLDATILRDADTGLTTKITGGPLAASTASLRRRLAKQMLGNAQALGRMDSVPWPGKSSKRLAERVIEEIDLTTLPDVAGALALIASLDVGTERGRRYELLSSIMLYAGPRPGEARALRIEEQTLPETGWGELYVRRTEVSAGKFAEEAAERSSDTTKTGVNRRVPAHPELVARIRAFIGDRTTGLIAPSRTGTPAAISHWDEAMAKARPDGTDWTPYTLRHLHASLALRAGVPLAECARRLGHSVPVLTGTYAGAIAGDEEASNLRIADALAGTAVLPAPKAPKQVEGDDEQDAPADGEPDQQPA